MVEAWGTQPVVEIGGRPAPEAVEALLVEVEVDCDATGPDACTVTFADDARSLLDDLGVDFLTPVRVLASPAGTTDDRLLFDGEVYALDFEYDRSGAVSVLRAYDRSYRLRQGRVTTSFNDADDADVARALAGEVDLGAGGVAATDVVHPHLAVVNESRWDFLARRAKANGMELGVDGAELRFARPEPRDGDTVRLVAGEDLLAFRVRASAAQQVGEVEVRGWDYRAKQAVGVTAPAASVAAAVDDAPGAVGGRHPGRPRHVAAHPMLTTQAECEAAVGSVAEHLAGTFGYAEGSTEGNPGLRSGATVEVAGTGRFDGAYTLTRARHRFDGHGYRTWFVASSVHDRSLFGLTRDRVDEAPVGDAAPGVVPAVVTGIQDPEDLGRVRLRFPWLADDYESDWARVVQIGAGPERGLLWFPEVGDEVLAAFVDGDRRRPVVVGGLYNGQDRPPFGGYADATGGRVERRGMRTAKGHELVFEEADGGERIEVRTADGKLRVVLDQAAGRIVVDADGDLELRATGQVVVAAGGDLRLEASGRATLAGSAGVDVESPGSVAVSGQPIRLN